MSETSMNFDAESVEPFFERIASLVSDGFDHAEVVRLANWFNETEHDAGRDATLQVVFDGEPLALQISVFMDDFESPDIAFSSSAAFIQAIEAEYEQFCEEIGI